MIGTGLREVGLRPIEGTRERRLCGATFCPLLVQVFDHQSVSGPGTTYVQKPTLGAVHRLLPLGRDWRRNPSCRRRVSWNCSAAPLRGALREDLLAIYRGDSDVETAIQHYANGVERCRC